MKTTVPMLLWLLLLAPAGAAALLLTCVTRSRDVRQPPPGGYNRVERWFSALCAIPWLLIVGGYMEAFVVRLVLSRWPRPSLDDPKQLATAPLHLAVQLMFLSLLGAIPLLIVFTLMNWRKVFSQWRYFVRIGAFCAGLLAIWVLGQYDPGHVWAWLLD